jgi:thiamine pyrophosphate-dependent acetolactate synthase large subunit-like protein
MRRRTVFACQLSVAPIRAAPIELLALLGEEFRSQDQSPIIEPFADDVRAQSADARDLGRTYSTKLALVGDIRASLRALLPLLTPKLADRSEVYAALRKAK